MKKTNNLGFIGFLGFLGFLGFRAVNHPQLAYLSLLSFGSFLAFFPTIEVSKVKSVLHPQRKWFLSFLFSLFFLFYLFGRKPELCGLATFSFLAFLACTKPARDRAAEVEPRIDPYPVKPRGRGCTGPVILNVPSTSPPP